MASLRPLEDSDHIDGPDDAPFELVMFADFQCPYCIAAHPILGRVRERLGGRLRFSFRHLPIRDSHPDAQAAAEAAEAAAAQDAFWPMYELLYESRGKLARADLVGFAQQLGLNVERFEADLDSGAHAARVERDLTEATELGVTGTPAFFTNGHRHDGAFDFASLVEALEG